MNDLTAVLEECRSALMECDRDGDYPLIDRIDSLLAAAPTEAKPAQQDAVDAEHAENYRWLRDNADIDEGPAVVDQRCNDWGKWYSIQVKGDELDSAIRAAISAKKGG